MSQNHRAQAFGLIGFGILGLAAGIAGCGVVDGATDAAGPTGATADAGTAPVADTGSRAAPDAGTGSSADTGGTDGTGSVVRTLVYHQVTSEPVGVDSTKGFAASRDGSRAAFVVSNNVYNVTVVNADGSGRRVVEQLNTGWIGELALSGDGALVAYQGAGRPLRVARTDGSSAPQDVVSAAVRAPRFARDPADAQSWRIYFVLPADVGGPHPLQRGVYSIKPDGSGLLQLLSASEVAVLTGVTPDVPGTRNDNDFTLDVSADGTRFIAQWATGWCGHSGQRDYLIAGTTITREKRVLAGPITGGCGLRRVAISGDGNTVAYEADDGQGKAELHVMAFAGGADRKLATINPAADSNWGLSDDGARLLAGYAVYSTSGNGVFDAAVVGGSYSNDAPSVIDAFLGVLSGSGRRIWYVVGGAPQRYVALLDIDPPSLGAAPNVRQPGILPSSIRRDGPPATVTANVDSSGTLLRVASAVLLDGHDDSEGGCVQGEQVMKDDAQRGVFSSNKIAASSCAKPSSARSVRVRAEAQAADGRRHATVVEMMPFDIE